MSDEQHQAGPDDSEPSPERQAQLRAAYQANAAAEAIIGLFIELVFIATFTPRFFAR